MSAAGLQQHARLIRRLIGEGKVIPFLGAGANLCDRPPDTTWQEGGDYLPSGAELSRHLAARNEYPGVDDRDLVRVAQYVDLITGGEAELFSQLRAVFDGTGGNDCMDGASGADNMLGAVGPDRLFGWSGGDQLNGGPGSDYLSDGGGNDTINANFGRDRTFGGPGRDYINVATAGPAASADCGSGRDKVRFDNDERRRHRGCEKRYRLRDR